MVGEREGAPDYSASGMMTMLSRLPEGSARSAGAPSKCWRPGNPTAVIASGVMAGRAYSAIYLQCGRQGAEQVPAVGRTVMRARGGVVPRP